MQPSSLAERAKPFLDYLDEWTSALTLMSINEAVTHPAKAAVISVDITNGFCYEGLLSSPRVAEIVEPTADLFRRAWDDGIRNIVLIQDTHEPDAVEFAQFPAHCVRGTSESTTVDAFTRLPFFDQMVVLEKNSIASGVNAGLIAWLEAHPEIDTFIVVGDCTDLCTYLLAVHIRVEANERQLARRVIVPVNCVQTYDRPVEVALEQGGLPHPGDLLHSVFLYHMQLNGIEIVSKII